MHVAHAPSLHMHIAVRGPRRLIPWACAPRLPACVPQIFATSKLKSCSLDEVFMGMPKFVPANAAQVGARCWCGSAGIGQCLKWAWH